MDEKVIRDFLLENKINFQKNSTILGTIKPDIGAYNNGLGKIMHIMRTHILHFNSEGVAIVALDDNSGKILKDTLVFFKNKDIQIQIQIKILSSLLTIHTEKGDMHYKIRKSAIGCPWHKENFAYLLMRATQNPKI